MMKKFLRMGLQLFSGRQFLPVTGNDKIFPYDHINLLQFWLPSSGLSNAIKNTKKIGRKLFYFNPSKGMFKVFYGQRVQEKVFFQQFCFFLSEVNDIQPQTF